MKNRVTTGLLERLSQRWTRVLRRRRKLSFDHYLIEARAEVAATAFSVSILHGCRQTESNQPQSKNMQHMQQEEQ